MTWKSYLSRTTGRNLRGSDLKVEKDLTAMIRRVYLETLSIRRTAKSLDIKPWKVQKVVKDLNLAPKRVKQSNFEYLDNKNVTKETLIEVYLELGSFRKTAKKLNLGINRTKDILKELNVLKKKGHALKYNKNGENNPFYGKSHTEETKAILSKCTKERTGKRNPNYKNGSYLRRPRDYKISKMTKLRNFVFNRDSYTCKNCNQKGGHLHAHHSIPFWVKPEAFEDTDNMVTLCTDCHFNVGHNGNWCRFNLTFISDELLEKYSLDRERLSGLDAFSLSVCDSLNSRYK